VDYVLSHCCGRNGYSFGLIRTCCSPNHNSNFEEIPEVSELFAVSKLNPPIGGDVEAVTIEMEEYRS
jgi:hypothetical protein